MHASNLRDGKRDERLTDGSRETQPETVSFPKEKNHRANAVDYSIGTCDKEQLRADSITLMITKRNCWLTSHQLKCIA